PAREPPTELRVADGTGGRRRTWGGQPRAACPPGSAGSDEACRGPPLATLEARPRGEGVAPVPVEFNHTIVAASDARATAQILASVLGLEVGPPYGRFLPVATSNGVTLDVAETAQDPITPQPYASLVEGNAFAAIFARIRQAGIDYYAAPHPRQPGRINHRDGGRGLYFAGPNGHNLEILTRPYG